MTDDNRSALPPGHSVVSVEREVKVRETSVLTINGTQISLEGPEGEAISECLLSGKMPDQDLINHLLIRAGLLLKPAKNVEAEMNIREVNVNSQRTQVLKEGRVVDQNSTTTKEVKTSRQTSLINIWGSSDRPPPIDSNIPAELLAKEILPKRIAPTGEVRAPSEDHLFNVLLWSRLYATPAQLLTEVGSCLPALSENRHLSPDAREAFLGALVFLLSKWMTWFPEDFQDEAMTRKTRKIFSQIIELQSAAFSNRLNQLLSTLNSHLAAMRRHETWLDEKLSAANLDSSLESSPLVEPRPTDASATASELTRLELEHLAFLGPAEFISIFAKGSKGSKTTPNNCRETGSETAAAKTRLVPNSEDVGSPTKRRILSSIDDARMRAAGKTKKFDSYVSWFNRISYLVAASICKHKKKKHRVEVVEFWIEVARECVNIGNFNSMMGIITGLNLFPVARLKKTWTKIQSGKFAALEHQMDPSCNFRSYRSTFNAAISRSEAATDDRQRVTIPFFSLFVKDIYFAKENARLDLDGHALDLDKAGSIAAKVKEFCKWKDAPNCPYEKNSAIEKFLRKSPLWSDDELDFESFLCEPPTMSTEKERYKTLKEKYKRSGSTASAD